MENLSWMCFKNKKEKKHMREVKRFSFIITQFKIDFLLATIIYLLVL